MMKAKVANGKPPQIRTGFARARGKLGRTLLCGDSGDTIVEFAISATILVMLSFGVVQTCLALYTYNYVSDAARMASRYAVVRGSSCAGMPDCSATQAQILSYLQSIAYPGINENNLGVTATWLSASGSEPTTWTACANQCNAPGNAVQVKVTYPTSIFLPYWKHGTISLSSTSQMVITN